MKESRGAALMQAVMGLTLMIIGVPIVIDEMRKAQERALIAESTTQLENLERVATTYFMFNKGSLEPKRVGPRKWRTEINSEGKEVLVFDADGRPILEVDSSHSIVDRCYCFHNSTEPMDGISSLCSDTQNFSVFEPFGGRAMGRYRNALGMENFVIVCKTIVRDQNGWPALRREGGIEKYTYAINGVAGAGKRDGLEKANIMLGQLGSRLLDRGGIMVGGEPFVSEFNIPRFSVCSGLHAAENVGTPENQIMVQRCSQWNDGGGLNSEAERVTKFVKNFFPDSVVVWLSDMNRFSEFLHASELKGNVPDKKIVNTMMTNLHMGGNDIKNIGSLHVENRLVLQKTADERNPTNLGPLSLSAGTVSGYKAKFQEALAIGGTLIIAPDSIGASGGNIIMQGGATGAQRTEDACATREFPRGSGHTPRTGNCGPFNNTTNNLFPVIGKDYEPNEMGNMSLTLQDINVEKTLEAGVIRLPESDLTITNNGKLVITNSITIDSDLIVRPDVDCSAYNNQSSCNANASSCSWNNAVLPNRCENKGLSAVRLSANKITSEPTDNATLFSQGVKLHGAYAGDITATICGADCPSIIGASTRSETTARIRLAGKTELEDIIIRNAPGGADSCGSAGGSNCVSLARTIERYIQVVNVLHEFTHNVLNLEYIAQTDPGDTPPGDEP